MTRRVDILWHIFEKGGKIVPEYINPPRHLVFYEIFVTIFYAIISIFLVNLPLIFMASGKS